MAVLSTEEQKMVKGGQLQRFRCTCDLGVGGWYGNYDDIDATQGSTMNWCEYGGTCTEV
ncbi:hypothetical protein [Williamwhitmania taraxaci]|uniref:hypothetical protein n=1 Tax=Williamwhitmania taraxaci TaxID=1640674 RepID=UPI00147A88FB|nr:hypothetical protein [Williamwhitmania taraxaci]